MNSLKLKVTINKPVTMVFEFTTNPKNTHLWVPSIAKEETNEWPVKVGTIYKNTSDFNSWSEYVVTKFEKDKIFVFDKLDSNYHVQYSFRKIDDDNTELEYFEWVDEGELEEPFTMDILMKLKDILENN